MTTIWSGLSSGAVYALVALGYNICFIGSGTFNFAQASLTMLGVFLAYWGLSQLGWAALAVIVVALVIVALSGVTEERVAIRPVRQLQGLLVTTVGAATLITGVIEVIWGQQALEVPSFFTNNPLTVLGGRVLPDDLVLIGLALVFTAAFAAFSRFTMTGLAALAAAEDREPALLRGVNARRFQIGAFAIAGALAGLLGPFIGPKTFASFGLAQSLAIIAFVQQQSFETWANHIIRDSNHFDNCAVLVKFWVRCKKAPVIGRHSPRFVAPIDYTPDLCEVIPQ